jgi:methylmalonyl-CoA mutase C-terminal domain/subunit
MTDVLVFGGGIIPDRDIPKLKEIGISEIFPPGSSLQGIVDFVKTHVHN